MAALFSALPSGHAHEIPPRRQIVVQAEPGGAAVLVTWTSARGPQGAQLLGRALWGRRGDRALTAARSLAAAEALEGIEILADGEATLPSSTRVKLQIDPRSPARVSAAVLISVPRRGARTLTIRDRSRIPTRLMWTDAGAGRAVGPDLPGRWLPGRRHLTLTWKRSP